jgi:small subunit ribosomal protein S6
MLLIDNDVVREGWQNAKASVNTVVTKYGGSVKTSRRWDERRLAYPIRRRRRATFLLSHCELPTEAIANVRRDLDISETVLRYLFLRVDDVPAAEIELSDAEAAADFTVPEPPADDALDPEEIAALEAAAAVQAEREARGRRPRPVESEEDKKDEPAKAKDGEAKAEGTEVKAEATEAKAENTEVKAEEAPAEDVTAEGSEKEKTDEG